MPSSGIAGSYGSLIPSFLRNALLCRGDISLRSYQQCKRIPLFLHLLQHLLFVDFLDDGHPDPHEVISHFSFDLHFSNNERLYAFFSCVCWPTVCLLWRNVYLCLLPIFWLHYFSDIELHEVFAY